MADSDILGIPLVAAAQNQKEVTINDAIQLLEDSVNKVLTLYADSSDEVTITTEQWQQYGVFAIQESSPAPTGTIYLTVPAVQRRVSIINSTTQSIEAEIYGQSADPVNIANNTAGVIVSDGSSLWPAGSGSGGGVSVQEEGVEVVSSATTINFVGSNITATDGGGGTVDVTVGGDTSVITQSGTSRTLSLSDDGGYIRCTNGSSTQIIVPAEASVNFSSGTTIHICQAGIGKVTVSGETGVTINSPQEYSTRGQYSVVSLIKVGSDEWDLMGSLEEAST